MKESFTPDQVVEKYTQDAVTKLFLRISEIQNGSITNKDEKRVLVCEWNTWIDFMEMPAERRLYIDTKGNIVNGIPLDTHVDSSELGKFGTLR